MGETELAAYCESGGKPPLIQGEDEINELPKDLNEVLGSGEYHFDDVHSHQISGTIDGIINAERDGDGNITISTTTSEGTTVRHIPAVDTAYKCSAGFEVPETPIDPKDCTSFAVTIGTTLNPSQIKEVQEFIKERLLTELQRPSSIFQKPLSVVHVPRPVNAPQRCDMYRDGKYCGSITI